MLLGVDICGLNSGSIFNTTNFLGSYYSLQMQNVIVDDVYVSQDTNVTNTTTKPISWYSQDILNCNFDSNLEGGSISGNGQPITSVEVQNRLTTGLTWNAVATIPYTQGSNILFQYTDSYVQNGAQYEYVLIPFINNVQGITAPNSAYITAQFDATFITDKNNNYMLVYDIKQGSITNNVNSHVFEPLDSTYPIVQYGSLNYRTGKISATLLSSTSSNSSSEVIINSEVILRQNLIAFLNNRQAKLLRTRQGENILVVISDKSSISFPTSQPVANINFSFTEVGGIDTATLTKFGL